MAFCCGHLFFLSPSDTMIAHRRAIDCSAGHFVYPWLRLARVVFGVISESKVDCSRRRVLISALVKRLD
jgi:hypothetical protein